MKFHLCSSLTLLNGDDLSQIGYAIFRSGSGTLIVGKAEEVLARKDHNTGVLETAFVTFMHCNLSMETLPY